MPSSTASRSQRQRPGAKVLKSPKDIEKEKLQKLDKLLVRSADLELQLLSTTNDETKAYKLRAHYCEVLSDVLILNPKLALNNDCFQRLWRNCFYKPISIWRQRVSKEKRKRSPNLATSQEGYKSFLSEAIQLFDYLVIQYLSKLCPPSASQIQPSQSQQSRDTFESSQVTENGDGDGDGNDSMITTKSAKSLDGVVRGLYKLYIFLGDLHRYAEAYNKAEINYLNASKLGPGLGNPYNQLAVVAFTKEAYCVSLYWYSRSILATHEKFSTSSTNLERLFEKNHEYLMEHGRETTPTVLSLTTTSLTTTNNNNSNGKKNNKKTSSNSNSSMVRAQKAAASKSCLAHFVDLHYYFYQQQQLLQKQEQVQEQQQDDDGDNEIENKLNEKISNVIASLKSLVQASGFSDSLLCKIVVINNFSLERSKKSSSSERLSKELLFSIGIVLAEHIEGNLIKVLDKVKASAASNNMPKTTPSIRYLIPLEMLLDFVLKDIMIVDNKDEQQQQQQRKSNITTTATEDAFWKRILVVGNLIKEIVKGYKIDQNYWHGGKYCSQIKEYQLLKGYRPFSIVNKEYMSSIKNKDGYIEPIEAIEVLELSSTSTTQTTTQSQDTAAISTISTGTGTGRNGGIEENKAKLLRMLEICDSLATSSSAAPLTIKDDDGSYVYNHKDEDEIIDDVGGDDNEEDEEQEGGDFDMQSNHDDDDDDFDDEAGDVILFKSTNAGTGISDKPLPLPIVPVMPGVEISAAALPPRPSFSVITENQDKAIETTLLNTIMDAVPQPTEAQAAFANDVAMTDAAAEKTSSYQINNNMVHHHSSSPSLPDVVKPPPGFGGSITMPTQLYNTSAYNPGPANPALSLLPIHGLAPAADHSSSLYQLSQHQQHSIIPGLNLPPNSTQASLYPSNSVGSDLLNNKADSIRIFGDYGDIQTANPFVVDPVPSFSISNAANGNHNSSSVPNNHENNNTDVTKFLNAGLLNSLWMDESKTNNPWAGK
jgi:hypothetical protein